MDHGQTAGWFNTKKARRIFSLRASLEKCASSLKSIQRPCYCFHTSVSILWSQPLSLCFVSGEKVRSPAHFVTFPWISCLEPQPERKQPWAMVTSLIAKQRQVWRWVAAGGVGGRREEGAAWVWTLGGPDSVVQCGQSCCGPAADTLTTVSKVKGVSTVCEKNVWWKWNNHLTVKMNVLVDEEDCICSVLEKSIS